jgi:ubiquitin C-terminal hydrolase
MNNMGNTCYMNAILQCLLHTEDIVDFLLTNEKEIRELSNHINYKDLEMSESFINLYESYYEKKEKDFITPDRFRQTLIKKHPQVGLI